MESEPPTPTRAPDNQFRQMQYKLNYIIDTSLLNLSGWGRGFRFHRRGSLSAAWQRRRLLLLLPQQARTGFVERAGRRQEGAVGDARATSAECTPALSPTHGTGSPGALLGPGRISEASPCPDSLSTWQNVCVAADDELGVRSCAHMLPLASSLDKRAAPSRGLHPSICVCDADLQLWHPRASTIVIMIIISTLILLLLLLLLIIIIIMIIITTITMIISAPSGAPSSRSVSKKWQCWRTSRTKRLPTSREGARVGARGASRDRTALDILASSRVFHGWDTGGAL